MYDQMRYWITPDGELIDVPVAHHHVSKERARLSVVDALKHGWIRVIRDDRFGGYWYFEIQNAYDDETLALIEDFVMSPENQQTGEDVAASISTIEPEKMYFPIEWKDLEDSSFREAAANSFRRELQRREGYRWHELKGNPRRPRRRGRR